MTAWARRPPADLIAAGLPIIAALNGWAPRLLAENAPAVSLFAPVTLAIALAMGRLEVRTGSAPIWALSASVLVILVPSGAAAWVALASLGWLAVGPGATRWLLVGLASAELFAAVGLNLAKAFLLPLEAHAASGLLWLARVPAEVEGNAILVADRLTVVAAGCSGAPGALFAALGAIALLLWRRPRTGWRLCAAAAAAAALVAVGANLARLAVMAVDERLYDAAHGQWGALATDLAASAGVAAAVLLAERKAL